MRMMRTLRAILAMSSVCIAAAVAPVHASSTEIAGPLHMILLIDSSGSLKDTDPDDLRIVAAQAVLAFMTDDDHAAVVEFSSDARVLTGFRSGAEKAQLFDAAGRARKDGAFTDFRVGLAAAAELVADAPVSARKVILLLTDGRFEPNLASDNYAPYYLQYRKDAAGKTGAEKSAVQEQYRSKILPVARRIIESEIVPMLRDSEAEVYAVSLGRNADQGFLDYVTTATSRYPGEVHVFRAAEADQLTESFLQILHYMRNNMLVQKVHGDLDRGELTGSFGVDSYVRNVLAMAYSDNPFEMNMRGVGGVAGELIIGTHEDLKIARLPNTSSSMSWTYNFRGERGKLLMLAVGQSTLQIDIAGLKDKYLVGETVLADVALTINTRDAREQLADSSSVTVRVVGEKALSWQLPESARGYRFEFAPPSPGSYRVHFEVEARDRVSGRDLLPRTSKFHEFDVMPGFMVQTNSLDFGDMRRGASATSTIQVLASLTDRAEMTTRSSITSASADLPRIDRARLPTSPEHRVDAEGSRTYDLPVRLDIPSKCPWGDFEGVIVVEMAGFGAREVPFRVHIPSIWEKLRLPTLVLLAILVLLLVALVIAWGRLGNPVGTLRPLQVPGGEVLDIVRVGRVRRGFFARTFNFRRNVITFGRTKADVRLRALPESTRMELRFYRFGGNYVVNSSSVASGAGITIVTDLGDLERKPGQSTRLRNGIKIRIGGYVFEYRRV